MKGYDDKDYGIGDRVEIHPATDFWMSGIRYGVVTDFDGERVTVKMDKATSWKVVCMANMLRKVD